MVKQVRLRMEGIAFDPEHPKVIPTAPVQPRSKEIGSPIPIVQTTSLAKNGVARGLSQ
jgi:hypothetical protein